MEYEKKIIIRFCWLVAILIMLLEISAITIQGLQEKRASNPNDSTPLGMNVEI